MTPLNQESTVRGIDLLRSIPLSKAILRYYNGLVAGPKCHGNDIMTY